MRNKTLPLADLAKHYARHLQQEDSASQYLVQQGVELSCEFVESVDSQQPELSKPDNVSLPLAIKKISAKGAFDFPIYSVTKRSKNKTEYDDELTGLAYDSNTEYRGQQLPKKPDIEPFSETLQKIIRALSDFLPGAKVDVKALVKDVAQQNKVDELPVLNSRSIPGELTIVVDKSDMSLALYDDAFGIAAKLEQNWSECRIETLVFTDGPGSEWGFKGQEPKTEELPILKIGCAILIIAEFEPSNIELWIEIFRQWQKRTNNIVWLTTSVPDSAYRERLPVSWIPLGKQKHITESDKNCLMALVMTMRYVPPGLLRTMIQLLDLPACAEKVFFKHPDVYYDPASDYWQLADPDPTTKQTLKQALNNLPINTLTKLNAIIEMHLAALSQSLLHEHRIGLHLACDPFQHKDIQKSYDFYASMGVSLKQKSDNQGGVALFLAKTVQRFGDDVQKADVSVSFKQTLGHACKYLTENNLTNQVPDSLLQYVLAPEETISSNKQTLEIRQSGQELQLVETTFLETNSENSLAAKVNIIAWLSASEKEPLFVQNKSSEGESRLQAIHRNLPDKLPKDLVLQSQFETLSITKRSASDFWWATKVSVISQGVVAETEHIKMIWPKDPHAINENTLNENSSFEFAKWDVKTGAPNRGSEGGMMCIKHNAPLWLHSNRPELDATGLVNRLEVNGVPFNLRYIPPGSFLMGSPDDEAERRNNETLHPVTLTKGFWMGETTVTQQLWEAVMADSSGGTGSDVNRSVANPSHFKVKGEQQLPVDSVNWHDCQTFCEKLKELTGAKFALPTEAQWEYACRAGTTTPFNTVSDSKGEQLSFEQGNYDVNFPYAGKVPLQLKPGQEYRSRTIDVHECEANRWGLKQMHGNVLEWCQDDWNGQLGSACQVDPVTSGDEAAFAVLRGGGWSDRGEYCRSAYRFYNGRDYRSNYIGLRVAQVLE